MARNATWTNSDGLVVGFGTRTNDNDIAGVVGGSGAVKTMVVELKDATGLEAVGSVTTASINPQSVMLPRGSRILEASFTATVAFTSGGSGTLEIGTHSAAAVDDDPNGIDAAIAKTALDAIGASVGCDGALVGGVTTAGAASTSDVHVTFAYGTAAMTAGAGVLTLRYIEPQGTQGASFAAVE